ncbi:MAG: glutamate racemase [Bacteroidia bacterium]|nr:glutamate racemase [Bacteroidia bacterium]
MHTGPIGIFDSGLGGLSVWKELVAQLPQESLLYVADSAHCPYGNQSEEYIQTRAKIIADFLTGQGCKLIVVACNTATAAAIRVLRQTFSVPFVGMEPAIKPAATHTRTGTIGVLATKGTLEGQHFRQARTTFAGGTEVLMQVGQGLVELVEQDQIETPEAERLLRQYLEPMVAAGADQIVLGCTHYPFLIPVMRQIIPAQVALVDPAPAVARRTRQLLEELNLTIAPGAIPAYTFYTTGQLPPLQHLAGRLLPPGHQASVHFSTLDL